MQLHFEFTWPELSEKEIKIALDHLYIKSEYFVVVDLLDRSIYTTGDLFKCKEAILNAQKFYNEYPEYLGRSYINRYYQRRHFQLLFKT